MSNHSSKHRICRIAGKPMCGLDKCPAVKRPFAPGQHGRKRNLERTSEYGAELLEKQKLKFLYGMRERQFRRFYEEAARDKQQTTGDALLLRMEMRMDNLVYRFGYARTIHAARQLVVHGHFTVDGHKVDRPSYCVSVGSTVRPTNRARSFPVVLASLDESRVLPPYLALDHDGSSGKLLRCPEPSEIPVDVNMPRIVEYYAR